MLFCALSSEAVKRLAAAILLLGAAACSGGGHGSDPAGGFVRLEHRDLGTASATYARAEFTDARTGRPKLERCAFAGPADANATWLDVGDAVTLERAGAAPIVMERASLGSLVLYGADGLPEGASPEGAVFDVSLPGKGDIEARVWEDAIEMPAALEVDAFVNQIGFLVDQPFTWTASGADEVIVEIAGAGDAPLVCRSKDDGEVLVPQEQNEQVSSSGGTVTFRAIRRRHAALRGTDVSLEGQSVVVVPYN